MREKKQKGRPTTRTKEIEDAICSGLQQGIPLRQLCRDLEISKSAVYEWEQADPEFSGRIARARVIGHDELAEQCLEIADTPVEGIEQVVKPNGDIEERKGDMLGHRKLQIETRMKLLAKWDPRRYGEKVAIGGADDLPPVKTETTLTAEEAYKRMLNGG